MRAGIYFQKWETKQQSHVNNNFITWILVDQFKTQNSFMIPLRETSFIPCYSSQNINYYRDKPQITCFSARCGSLQDVCVRGNSRAGAKCRVTSMEFPIWDELYASRVPTPLLDHDSGSRLAAILVLIASYFILSLTYYDGLNHALKLPSLL